MARRESQPRRASNMARTLHQLWADDDEARKGELERRQRLTHLRAKQGGRRRSSVVSHRSLRRETTDTNTLASQPSKRGQGETASPLVAAVITLNGGQRLWTFEPRARHSRTVIPVLSLGRHRPSRPVVQQLFSLWD